MPERTSPEMEVELQRLSEMADQLRTALAALKTQIDAADAAKAAKLQNETVTPESNESAVT
jgi:hypothetical protein